MSLWSKANAALSGYERLGKIAGTTIVIFGPIVAGVILLRDFLGQNDVGAWVPVVVGLPLLLLVLAAYVFGRRRGAKMVASSATRDLEPGVATAEHEKRLVTDALESIQQAIASEDIWELDRLVERGVLETARGFLLREAREDVRLSVLVPRDGDPDRFRMRWAAGHRPESVKHYNRAIDDTMAGLAYRRGELVVSGNVREDERFQANPKATRPFSSLVSMPVRIDEEIVGAFTVISTRTNAFGPTDVSFIKLIGAVLDVVLVTDFDGRRWEAYAEEKRASESDSQAPVTPKEDPKTG